MTQETLKQKLIAAQINPLYLPSSYHKVEVLPKLGTGKALTYCFSIILLRKFQPIKKEN
jgi:hypothetical protein